MCSALCFLLHLLALGCFSSCSPLAFALLFSTAKSLKLVGAFNRPARSSERSLRTSSPAIFACRAPFCLHPRLASHWHCSLKEAQEPALVKAKRALRCLIENRHHVHLSLHALCKYVPCSMSQYKEAVHTNFWECTLSQANLVFVPRHIGGRGQ